MHPERRPGRPTRVATVSVRTHFRGPAARHDGGGDERLHRRQRCGFQFVIHAVHGDVTRDELHEGTGVPADQ